MSAADAPVAAGERHFSGTGASGVVVARGLVNLRIDFLLPYPIVRYDQTDRSYLACPMWPLLVESILLFAHVCVHSF